MYKSLEECLLDLEKHHQLVRVKEEVDPYLEMAAIQLRMYEAKGPALLFENVKGTQFRCAGNIFGTLERSKFLFRDTLKKVQNIIALRENPINAIKSPLKNIGSGLAAINALPLKTSAGKGRFREIKISDLPQIHHWQMDGGAYITLPQVYTENIDKPGAMHSNLGMYRIQLSGNEFVADKEIGLHYQIHRGIGVHQSLTNKYNKPLKVSIFVGGPPAHTLSAVMPLPEGLSEILFAGLLGGRRFRYFYEDGFCISADADFVITGEIYPEEVKPEGPFGDHYGYYSLKHDFPLMRVHKVYAKENAIWPYTVVGRPPQEDTSFGQLIHEITGDAIGQEVPGLKEVHAVDAAGVHPLLLAIGEERYTPFYGNKEPLELLTIANRTLGTGQLSLAKYLFLTADKKNILSTHHVEDYLQFIFERIDLARDLHFFTETTIDTLDYTATKLNHGSKVAFVVHADKRRELCKEMPVCLKEMNNEFYNPQLVMPGIIALQANQFSNYDTAEKEMGRLNDALKHKKELSSTGLIVICDDSPFTAKNTANFVWVTFTRSNPSHDIYGINSFIKFKHFGCDGPLVIDARKKPHHAPELVIDEHTAKNINRLWQKGGSLYGIQ